jgi:cholestenol delta-isomerase
MEMANGLIGYYVYNFRTMAGHQHLFAQLWKEYAYSDSRYLTQDPFVLCMETITAVRLPKFSRPILALPLY